ncbi:hypothetical protein BKA56DRAFT_31483 [Ilyonectria sp. MPI-CAGE-AT-0026]|nr:hypothetical protein BKA56DRAFT_31483 [Ilyonectria sp. MPI-CAGE-AT-0026]
MMEANNAPPKRGCHSVEHSGRHLQGSEPAKPSDEEALMQLVVIAVTNKLLVLECMTEPRSLPASFKTE